MASRFTPGIVSLANFQILDEEYTQRRKVWKEKAPKHLLHSVDLEQYDKECGECWIAKQNLLLYNPEIYIWDGVSARISDDDIQKMYNKNVRKIETCSCLKN